MSNDDDDVDVTGTRTMGDTSPAGDGGPQEVTSYGRKAVLGATVGYAMDGYDLQILGFALPAITVGFGLSDTEGGMLATITLVGTVTGAMFFGALADRFGRVRILTYSILLFAIFTGLTALSQGFVEMAVFRFVAGMGIGGEFGIGMALAAEAFPAIKRARATSWVGLGFQFGVLLAAIISAPVISLWGWQGLFVIGIFPALVAVVLRLRLPEPEAFVRHRAGIDAGEKQKNPYRLLVADAKTVRTSIGIVIICSVQNFGYYGILTWLPTYLTKQLGLSTTKSGIWTAVTVIGMIAGIMIFGQLADRVGRRRSFWIFQAGAFISLFVYGQLTSPAAVLIGGAVMGIFANGMLGGYGAIIAENYPTAGRATAQNVLFGIGRGVGGFAPLVVALIAGWQGFGAALGFLALIYIIDMVAMLLIPDRRGERLDETVA
ncbi:MFS transporter [Amycolatopsis acidiphila]|uniref:MFS transporter n=1 Tax=Amycolatopsis acidiphila TaxID=715473 RepID=A0A558ANP0_9PSEU|nr:MFS transporter [Amycolatopsis acidiphila]TVT25877.1 MFS transporter [Amycolatopsis acidiphila]UIJ63427.1 MFS transporter [Amycolatopsis acidiphila]GHG75554.1 putative metabolite transport protein [Amycolatopsis acidiphila]